jgi:hypothetical protein
MDTIICVVIRKIVLPVQHVRLYHRIENKHYVAKRRLTDITTGSKAALDKIFEDPSSSLLYVWKVGTDPWNSYHFSIFIEYDGILEPKRGSKKAYTLHNKNTDWSAFMEEVKEEITK